MNSRAPISALLRCSPSSASTSASRAEIAGLDIGSLSVAGSVVSTDVGRTGSGEAVITTQRPRKEHIVTSGMKLVVFPTKDVDGAKKIFSTLLGTDPYADGPYYVGFRAGGLEIGLDPNGTDGPICYWDTDDIEASVQSLVAAGATLDEAAHDVGRALLVAKVKDADGNVVGLRQSP